MVSYRDQEARNFFRVLGKICGMVCAGWRALWKGPEVVSGRNHGREGGRCSGFQCGIASRVTRMGRLGASELAACGGMERRWCPLCEYNGSLVIGSIGNPGWTIMLPEPSAFSCCGYIFPGSACVSSRSWSKTGTEVGGRMAGSEEGFVGQAS